MSCESNAFPGYLAQVYVNQVSTPVAELKDLTINVQRDTIDVSSHAVSGWKRHILGLASWTASASYLYVINDEYQDLLYDSLILGEDADPLTFYFRPKGESSVTGDPQRTGAGLITSWEETDSTSDASMASIEILGCGPLTLAAI